VGSRKINLSTALSEQLVGIREVDDKVWQVSFLEYDLGYFDRDQDRVEPGPDPFAPDTVLTMCPEREVNHVTGIHPRNYGSGGGLSYFSVRFDLA
jgi:putative transposase